MNKNKKSLKHLFTIFFLVGVPLPGELEQNLLARCPDENWVRITRDPVIHFALELVRHWENKLKDDRILAVYAQWLLVRLSAQMGYHRSLRRKRESYDELSLAARRLWRLAVKDIRYLDPTMREERLRHDEKLPVAHLSQSDDDMSPASESAIDNFLSWAGKFEKDFLPEGEEENSDLEEDAIVSRNAYLDGDEVCLRHDLKLEFEADGVTYRERLARRLQADSALAQMQAGATCFEPVALNWLRDMVQIEDFREYTVARLRHALLWLLELHYGVAARHGLKLGLRDEPSTWGCLSASELMIRVNGGHFHLSECWDSDDLRLPLAPVVSRIVQELLRRFPEAKKVTDLHDGSENLIDSHRETAYAVIRQYLKGWEGKSIRIDRVWFRVAILECDLPAALVGLMRGLPLGGARGQSAYVSLPYRAIVNALNKLLRQLYTDAGVPFQDLETSFPEPNRMYGKRAMSMHEFASATLDHIRAARTENELIACLIRLFRGLGFRKRNAQLNPWVLYRNDLFPLLEIVDKLTGDWLAPRFVPLSAAFLRLVRLVRRIFGDREHLTFVRDGRWCSFDGLSGKEQVRVRSIWGDDEDQNAGRVANPGRTALFNALLVRSCGEVPRQALLGHGPSTTHLNGSVLPVPPLKVLQIARNLMLSICSQEGLDTCAKALTERLAQIAGSCPPSSEAVPEADSPATLDELEETRPTPSGMHRPMDYRENCSKNTIYRHFRSKTFPDKYAPEIEAHRVANAWPRDEVGLLGAAAVQLNLPLKILLDFQAYYSYESFLYDCQSQTIWFRVVLGHHDDGGLAEIPVFVCSFSDEKNNRLMKLMRYRFDRAVVRLAYKRQAAAKDYAESRLRREGAAQASLPADERQGAPDEVQAACKTIVLRQRLFGPTTLRKREVGVKLGFLLGTGQQRPPPPFKAYGLLNRIAQCRCTIWYPPLLAGVLCGRGALGLNHFSLQDLFDVRNHAPSRIQNILGEKWTEVADAASIPKMDKRALALLKKQMCGLTIGDWKDVFRDYAGAGAPHATASASVVTENATKLTTAAPEHARIREKIRGLSLMDWKILLAEDSGRSRASFTQKTLLFLRGMGISKREAGGLPGQILNFLRREGKLYRSTPLPLVTQRQLVFVVEKASGLILKKYAARKTDRFSPQHRVELKNLQLELVQGLEILHAAKLRPKELFELYTEDMLFCGERIYFHVKDGKTENAPRMVVAEKSKLPSLNLGLESNDAPAVAGPRLLRNLVRHHKSHDATTAILRNSLRTASGKNMKPYDLRHLGIIFAVGDQIGKRLATGISGMPSQIYQFKLDTAPLRSLLQRM